jgi:hypothetical protein
MVVEVVPHDQYTVKTDGSGRLAVHNRRFLRAFTPPFAAICGPTTPPVTFDRCAATPPADALSPAAVLTILDASLPVVQSSSAPVNPPASTLSRASLKNCHVVLEVPFETPAPLPPATPPIECYTETCPAPSLDMTPVPRARSSRLHQLPANYELETGTWVQP